MKGVLAVLLFVFATVAHGWESKTGDKPSESEVQNLTIDDVITLDTLKEVKKAIAEVRSNPTKTMLAIKISSPGGHAIAGLAIAKALRKLSDEGKVKVAIYADSWCASACTFVLASGTPGLRTIDSDAVVLVHALQHQSMLGSVCVVHKDKPDTQDEKIDNVLLELARDLYIRFTGKDQKTVESWLSCGFEKAGRGQLAVDMGLADSVIP